MSLLLIRFTSAVRSGIKFAGTEKITLGGGEAMWLYINGIKLIDYVSTGAAVKECFYIDLSPALTVGGGIIVPQEGTISGSTCTGLSAMSTNATMELEVKTVLQYCIKYENRRLEVLFFAIFMFT